MKKEKGYKQLHQTPQVYLKKPDCDQQNEKKKPPLSDDVNKSQSPWNRSISSA